MQSTTSNFELRETRIWNIQTIFITCTRPFRLYSALTTVRVYQLIFSHQQLYRSIPFDLPPTVILSFPTYKQLRIREYPRNSKDAWKDFFRGRFIGRTLRSIFNCAHFSNSLFPPILLVDPLSLPALTTVTIALKKSLICHSILRSSTFLAFSTLQLLF